MSLFDAFRYDGKRELVVGGATGMGAATAELERWLGVGADYRSEAATESFTALEQACALAFLCSDAAAATGVTLTADAGYFSSGITGSFPAASPFVNMLLNRS